MAFTPRLTPPTDFSTYYGSENSYNRFRNNYIENNSGGNCTWYAYGRTSEIANKNLYNDFVITGGDGSGKYWIQNTWTTQTITNGNIDLQLGDILVWGEGQFGHVEVVEKIEGDSITTSYSIYGSTYEKSKFFGVRNIQIPTWNSNLGYVEYNDGTTGYLTNKFIGYIHNKYLKLEDLIFFRRGDYVKILKVGKAQANGGGRNAYGIGWERQVIKSYPSQPYPIRVGFMTGETTGFYKQQDLKLIRRV